MSDKLKQFIIVCVGLAAVCGIVIGFRLSLASHVCAFCMLSGVSLGLAIYLREICAWVREFVKDL